MIREPSFWICKKSHSHEKWLKIPSAVLHDFPLKRSVIYLLNHSRSLGGLSDNNGRWPESLNGNQLMVCRWPPPAHLAWCCTWHIGMRKPFITFVGVSNNHQFLQMVPSCPTLVKDPQLSLSPSPPFRVDRNDAPSFCDYIIFYLY